MRLLLLLIFTAASFFSYAGKTNDPATNKAEDAMMATCMPIALFICLLLAGALYLLDTRNKRRSTSEKDNAKKNE